MAWVNITRLKDDPSHTTCKPLYTDLENVSMRPIEWRKWYERVQFEDPAPMIDHWLIWTNKAALITHQMNVPINGFCFVSSQEMKQCTVYPCACPGKKFECYLVSGWMLFDEKWCTSDS